MHRFPVVLLLVLALPVQARQQTVTEADYARAESFLGQNVNGLVYGNAVRPVWLDGDSFWYRNAVKGGAEFILVDPSAGTRVRAFDHDRLAASLTDLGDTTYTELGLPFQSFEFVDGQEFVRFSVDGDLYTCSLSGYECEVAEGEGSGSGDMDPRMAMFRRFMSTEVESPDGSKEAFIRDFNLWVRDKASGEETQLTTDGEERYGYATNNAGWTKSDRPVLLWSPDSKKIATFRHDGRGVGMMYLVSTKSGHPDLEAWQYPMPGDSVIFRIERVVIDVDEPRLVRLQIPPDAHRSTIYDHVVQRSGDWADIEWSPDSRRLVFVSTSRDHKTEILRVADPETGSVRDVFTEVEGTFYESGFNVVNNRLLDASDEYIWYSQRDDWGHLYLYDLATGELKNRITSGDWKVLGIEHIDEASRTIWFTGAGREPGDPYFQYLYSVKMDGSDLRLLTPDSLNHTITFSPSFRYFIDSSSSPDTPNTIILRDARTGRTVMPLEKADISELLAAGWKPPIPFVTRARDGETDIYGLMYTPTNLDPEGSYPVLNYIYPGPQTGSVGSRSFVAARSDKQAVSELGFVVVEMDAMGSPMRSHSFHAFYYGNMGDNGLPDNIAGIRELASRHPYMDIDRVGIWGHSGGGFASTAGILRHPDFYDVAVSGAGNHDNATYEDDWGEKWQGLLVRNEDGTTTYDNQANYLVAENLKGKLLLAHGSMDSNVPPNNTLLVAEALMNAGKDFDMLLFPNSRHGFRQGNYWTRRRWDYFVRHLIGVEPPKEYTIGQ